MLQEGKDFMKSSDVFMISADAQEIEINRNELALRLGVSREYDDELIRKCRQMLLDVIDYKCAYIRTDIDMSNENVCNFGFMTVDSSALYKNLNGCSEAFVFAVTTGIAVDRLLARLKIISSAEYFVTDAIASAAADSFCAYAAGKMKEGLSCPPRFSPGYADLSLRFQLPLLSRLDAHGLLGITLDNAYLMTPVKSITAIMGIRNEKDN